MAKLAFFVYIVLSKKPSGCNIDFASSLCNLCKLAFCPENQSTPASASSEASTAALLAFLRASEASGRVHFRIPARARHPSA